jgi:hypothetical protein
MSKKLTHPGILVAPENLDQLQLALAAGEGRAIQRCLTPPELVTLAAESEARFDDLLVMKSERPGARMTFVVEGPSKRYPRSAQATQVALQRRGKGWYLLHVRRVVVYPGQQAQRWFRLTESQKSAARERFEKKLQKI